MEEGVGQESISRRSAHVFFFSSRRRHTRLQGDWSSDVCSSDLGAAVGRPQHDDLGPRVRYSNDGVQELALEERAALDLETKLDKERRHRVEVGDGDRKSVV